MRGFPLPTLLAKYVMAGSFFNSSSYSRVMLSVYKILDCGGAVILIKNCGFSEEGKRANPMILKIYSDRPNNRSGCGNGKYRPV